MKNFWSLLSGLAIGAGLGLLFAPYEGKELRERIKIMAKEKMPDLSGERLEQFVDEVLAKIRREECVPEEVEEDGAEA